MYFISDPLHSSAVLKTLLSRVYEVYCDYVLKNPFFSLEQPIRCEKFDYFVKQVVSQGATSTK